MREANTNEENTGTAQAGECTVYYISVVAEMVETHPQTLRTYEKMGLIAPRRTNNNVRLFTEADVERVRRIQHLTQDLGVNLAGVEEIMRLRHELDGARSNLEGNVRRIQDDLSERMTKLRTLPSPEDGERED